MKNHQNVHLEIVFGGYFRYLPTFICLEVASPFLYGWSKSVSVSILCLLLQIRRELQPLLVNTCWTKAFSHRLKTMHFKGCHFLLVVQWGLHLSHYFNLEISYVAFIYFCHTVNTKQSVNPLQVKHVWWWSLWWIHLNTNALQQWHAPFVALIIKMPTMHLKNSWQRLSHDP